MGIGPAAPQQPPTTNTGIDSAAPQQPLYSTLQWSLAVLSYNSGDRTSSPQQPPNYRHWDGLNSCPAAPTHKIDLHINQVFQPSLTSLMIKTLTRFLSCSPFFLNGMASSLPRAFLPSSISFFLYCFTFNILMFVDDQSIQFFCIFQSALSVNF